MSGYEFLKQLAEKKDAEHHSFQDFYTYLDSKARKQGIPIHAQFELTPLCNFNCRMCYVHLTKEQMQGKPLLSVEQWKDIISQAWMAGMIRATLTGGECLTYPGFKEVYLHLRNLGCEITVLTNGALIDEEWIRFFRENRPLAIQVTLYGQNEEVYERVTGQRYFTKVIENIRIMLDVGLPVNLVVTPSKYLGEDVFDTIRLGKSFGVSFSVNDYLITPREETGRSEQQHDSDIDFYVKIKHFLNDEEAAEVVPEDSLPPIGGHVHECSQCGLQCSAGRSGFFIDWKGTMNPCSQLMMVKGFPLRDGFSKAWKQINQIAESWPRVPECEDCAYASVCSRCAARMLRFTEPGKQPLPMCEQTKYFVQHGIWHIPGCE